MLVSAFPFPLFISRICHRNWEHKAAISLSPFTCATNATRVLKCRFVFRDSEWLPLPQAEQRAGHWVTHICKRVVLEAQVVPSTTGGDFMSFSENTPRAVCLFHTTNPTGHVSLCVTAKSCCFLPLGLRGDTVSFAASPDAHHKVTGCSKEIYIELASFTSDTAIPFVSLSSQLRSLKPAPKTIFFSDSPCWSPYSPLSRCSSAEVHFF